MSLLLCIIISFIYCEVIWFGIVTQSRPINFFQRLTKWILILNVVMAFLLHSIFNLQFAIILSLYYFVIIPKRIIKTFNGPVVK